MNRGIIFAAAGVANLAAVCLLCLKSKKVSELRIANKNLEEKNKELSENARTDELTGLLNRFALRKDFDMYRGKDVSVVLMDIDSFKEFNDTNGHDFGDAVLKDVAEQTKIWLYKANCYRYGGDEFLIIAEGIEPYEMNADMESLQCVLDCPSEDVGVPVEISYGCMSGRINSTDDLRRLIHKADEILYEVKAEKGSHR